MRLQVISILICVSMAAAEYRHARDYGHGSGHGHSQGHGYGGHGGHNQGHHGHHQGHHVDYYAAPHYEFEYSVHDPHTGDFKSQRESRKGDVVKGYYTLKEADGTTREVHYTADKHHGFNAIVKRIGHAVHPHHTSHYSELSYH
ncbi:Cuticular protein [Nesidiocoris tenuis]|uniref:Cuticular protein n=1 Tax=Nesidiocoris tenuis TaxID=355587 RepID=A0ABN7B8Y4_9HEMI|nr:Cuticular protein [Nesidiocoris tenuis]